MSPEALIQRLRDVDESTLMLMLGVTIGALVSCCACVVKKVTCAGLKVLAGTGTLGLAWAAVLRASKDPSSCEACVSVFNTTREIIFGANETL